YLSPRVIDVGEDAGRSAKNPVLERHALVQTDIVLDLAVVADDDVGPNDNVLTNRAVSTDPDAREDVGEVPDTASGTDLDLVVDICRFMNLHGGKGPPGSWGSLDRRWLRRFEAFLHPLQDPQHAHSLAAVGARCLA